MVIKSKIEKALNKQINVELGAFYSYLSMAAYFGSHHMTGFAAWYKVQSNEEFKHAMRLYEYIISRGGIVVLTSIEAPQEQWKSFLSVFESAYAQELTVTGQIHDLINLARSEGDYATEIMLQWFITEQVEEENTAKNNVENFKFIKNTTEGVVVFDHELGQRK
ncbi:MAG: ferritin [Candidatus Omnitrophica bacterium]|nr:ferritin [Candidatus Omnitrophota bacterium]